MIRSRAAWREVRREALVFLATLLAGGGAVAAAWHLYQAADRSLSAVQARRQNSQQILADIEREKAELIASLGPYRELVDRSVIGDEQRLQWRDTLEAEQGKAGIDKLSYNLSPRQPWTADAGDGTAENVFRRQRSTMEVKVEFRRETALVDFLENVSKNGHAMALVRACDIARAIAPGQSEERPLRAECVIDWATLRRALPADGAPAS